MPDPLRVLLDQNIPGSVAGRLCQARPHWRVLHAQELGLAAASDAEVFAWAQTQQAIITYDQDFADRRVYPLGSHHGVVRLRVYPTSAAETRAALQRVLGALTDDDLREALVVVDRRRIPIQPPPAGQA